MGRVNFVSLLGRLGIERGVKWVAQPQKWPLVSPMVEACY